MKNLKSSMNPMNCSQAAEVMPDLLFSPGAAPAAARAHLETCASCQQELATLSQTMQLLDGWKAPEPSPFWTARMGARLREEQAQPSTGWAGFSGWSGWIARLRTRLWLSNYSLKPAAGVAALGLVLVAGGGTWLDLASHPAAPPAQASNTVRDLQSLNENAQVFQQLSALDSPDTGTQGND